MPAEGLDYTAADVIASLLDERATAESKEAAIGGEVLTPA
jgi:hypothetical protein